MSKEIILPTLHAGQVKAFSVLQMNRFIQLQCGRRYGKTEFGKTLACDLVARGMNVGWFVPSYKIQTEAYAEIAEILDPIRRSSSKTEGIIRTRTRGRLDFWSLENDRAGRGRKYHLVIIDEAAFTKKNAFDIWEKNVRMTLADYRGKALVMSSTNGKDPDNFFYRINKECNPDTQFVSYEAATHDNPLIDRSEIEELKRTYPPLVYQQECLAKFVDWSGVQFFDHDKFLVDGRPLPMPERCDAVFAVVDSAMKDEKKHDGTGVTFFAMTKHDIHPLKILDWDVVQIKGAMLDEWLPSVFMRLEYWSKMVGARLGSLGTWIEDKSSGTILLQQGEKRGWLVHSIDSKLTSLGKDQRAIAVSGHVHTEKIKFTVQAYDKMIEFKGQTKNHLLTQVVGYRVGVDNKTDDLFDTFCYGAAIALGNNQGF